MRIFVASWFFPPNTSAEGIVTYKLLKNSKHQYDVCCSRSKSWSYERKSELIANNINTYAVKCEKITEWVDECVKIFIELNEKYHYKYIMTRSMPPESILIGKKIKKIIPTIKWIASFGDPIYRNPYELEKNIEEDYILKKIGLNRFFIYHPFWLRYLLALLPVPKFKVFGKLYSIEKKAMKEADIIIVPSKKQLQYLLENFMYKKYTEKCHVIPHTYDLDMFGKEEKNENSKIIITYIGYLDKKRIPIDLFRALQLIKRENNEIFSNVILKFVGNIDSKVEPIIDSMGLGSILEIEDAVSYQDSLKIMKNSDYLLHIDAHFDFLKTGSIFFASKISDYIGSGKRILALTDRNSEAASIMKICNGIILERGNVRQIYEKFKWILETYKKEDSQVKEVTCIFSAKYVAKYFDQLLITER